MLNRNTFLETQSQFSHKIVKRMNRIISSSKNTHPHSRIALFPNSKILNLPQIQAKQES